MKLHYFVSVAVLLLALLHSVALASELTLGDALTLTLERNSELQGYPYEKRVAAANRIQAEIRPNPVVGFELENLSSSGTDATLSFSRLIELGDKREQRIAYASETERQIDAEFEYAKVEVLAEATRRFYQIIELQNVLSWNESTQNRLQTILDIAEERIDAGAIPSSDAIRVRLAVSKVEAESRELYGRIDEAKARLTAMWSGTVDFTRVTGEMFNEIVLPSQTAIEHAANLAPEYLRIIDAERLLEAKSQTIVSESTADLTVGLGVRYNNEFNETGLVLKLSMPWQITNPNQGRIQANTAERDMLLNRQRVIRDQIRSYGRAVLVRLETHQAYLENIDQSLLPLAYELTDETLLGFERGNHDLLQVLDAQNEISQIEYEQIKRRSAIYLDLLELERLTGQSFLEVTR